MRLSQEARDRPDTQRVPDAAGGLIHIFPMAMGCSVPVDLVGLRYDVVVLELPDEVCMQPSWQVLACCPRMLTCRQWNG